jgi:hypothetical protein
MTLTTYFFAQEFEVGRALVLDITFSFIPIIVPFALSFPGLSIIIIIIIFVARIKSKVPFSGYSITICSLSARTAVIPGEQTYFSWRLAGFGTIL